MQKVTKYSEEQYAGSRYQHLEVIVELAQLVQFGSEITTGPPS